MVVVVVAVLDIPHETAVAYSLAAVVLCIYASFVSVKIQWMFLAAIIIFSHCVQLHLLNPTIYVVVVPCE